MYYSNHYLRVRGETERQPGPCLESPNVPYRTSADVDKLVSYELDPSR